MTTKLQKIWMLTDEPTGLSIVALHRGQLSLLEHSTSYIEQGYFISAEQLREVAEYIAWLAFEAQNESPRDGTNVIETFRKILKERNLFDELGVEDE